jgi:PAS domain S-box-containing protein
VPAAVPRGGRAVKLFTKTFFFFICLIMVQAALTGFIITDIVEKSNLEDARKELGETARSVYDNFTSWKTSMWIELVALSRDPELKEILADPGGREAADRLTAVLRERLLTSGIDLLVFKSSAAPFLRIIPRRYSTLSVDQVEGLSCGMPHPYLRLAVLGDTPALVGACRLPAPSSVDAELFLIKRIDGPFCGTLFDGRVTRVALFLDQGFLVGSAHADSLLPSLSDLSPDPVSNAAYRERYGLHLDRGVYNLALRRLGGFEDRDRDLVLGVFMSYAPYQRRLGLIKETILFVTLGGALFTALVSLFMSRNLARPVKRLLQGMRSIRAGRYDTEVATGVGGEIGQLAQGFNQMARTLGENKRAMERYIGEITRLKDYNEKIIHSIRAGIAIVNRNLEIEKTNRWFLQLFGRSEDQVAGRNLRELGIGALDEEVAKKVRSLARRRSGGFTMVKRTLDHRVFEIKLYPLGGCEGEGEPGCVLAVEDISEKVNLEQKLFEAEKLATVSVLSAGVAHEINNPLGSIMSNVQNLIDEEEDEDRKTALRWIEQETRRIARTVRELLNFASPPTESTGGTDVNQAIEKVIRLIGYSLSGRNIRIDTRFAGDLPHASIGEDELQQVVINIIKNAVQAIDGEGLIQVTTSCTMNRRMLRVQISDNGGGISREHLSRIFDPFFTTKPNGEGTGLGLSVVYGIMRRYNAAVHVSSEEGRGTRVRLDIPVR